MYAPFSGPRRSDSRRRVCDARDQNIGAGARSSSATCSIRTISCPSLRPIQRADIPVQATDASHERVNPVPHHRENPSGRDAQTPVATLAATPHRASRVTRFHSRQKTSARLRKLQRVASRVRRSSPHGPHGDLAVMLPAMSTHPAAEPRKPRMPPGAQPPTTVCYSLTDS